MKINNFQQSWEIFVTALAILFLILLSIGGIISIMNSNTTSAKYSQTQKMTSENIEKAQKAEEKFEIVGRISDTRRVRFKDKTGGELYIHISPSGGVCEIEIGSDGSRRLFASYDDFEQEIKEDSNGGISDDKTCKLIAYFYQSPPVFENKCLGYIDELPKEVQTEVIRTIYLRDLLL